jgi:hypothetical protein
MPGDEVNRRGTTNTAIRGSAKQRRRSKQALLDRDGDGVKAPCWECGTLVDFVTMVRDKIKPGRAGGRYVLGNLRVHCSPCSMRQGARMGNETRRWHAWKKAGLRRSRVGADGLQRPYWCVYLAGQEIGYVVRTADGNWMYRGRARASGGHQTLRAALYALLMESTTNRERKAA